MRKIYFLPAALLVGMVACNNADNKAAGSTDTTAKTTTDTMVMAKPDSSTAAMAMPAIPAGAKVYFKNLKDGETVKSPVKVEMGVDGMALDTAGKIVPGTGHHHLLIDAPVPPLDQPIPSDRNHLHFGLGQTETVVELTPGTHTLQLLMGDADHVPHDPPLMSRRITIHVRAAAGQ